MITYPISSNLCKKIVCYVICSTIFHLSEATTGSVLLEKMFLEISQNLQENNCGKVSFLIKLQTEATASDFSRVFSWSFLFISFQQENEMKKGKYPDGVKIFTFLLEYQFVLLQRFQKKFDKWYFNQKMFLKRICCCSFHG